MILLQILDEGSITDSQGRKVDFKVYNYFIIYSHLTHWFDPEYYNLPNE